jgi:prolyl oligopeptidase
MTRLGSLLLLGCAGALALAEPPKLPETPKKPWTASYHGVQVDDPYHWLEDTADPAVRQWAAEQTKRARAVLDSSPALPPLRKRLRELMAAPSVGFSGIQVAGGTTFAMMKQPPKEQPMLVTLKSVDDPASVQVLLDPNALDSKGRTAIDFFVPSRDGKLVAVSLSQNGTEDGTVHVYEVATRKKLPDVVPRVHYPTGGGDLAWDEINAGFYYTRYPHAGERPTADLNFFQQVYHHTLGTPETSDTYVLGKELPRIAEILLETSDDGRYLLATVLNGDGGEVEHHLRSPAGAWTRLTRFADDCSAAVFGRGADTGVYLVSRKGAPHGQVLRLDRDAPDLAKAAVFVPPGADVLEGLMYVGHTYSPRLLATPAGLYVIVSAGGPEEVRLFDRTGRPAQSLPLPPVSSVRQLVPHGDEVLVHAESFLTPPAWYAYRPGDARLRPTGLAEKSPADFSDTEAVREFAVSKDGTKVPLNILRRKGTKLDGTNPTLLTGYGGFGISQTPAFRAANRVWLEQGGVLAIGNLRGGNEYGAEWHQAGMMVRKQNVFDDFLACARDLIDRGYTSPQKLAIKGGSNGGLLMGAVLTQHPELFRAVVAQVGLFDMLRFEEHPNGVFVATEYGSVKDPSQFRALFAYSPYHHVRDGVAYPAVLLRAGINDGRVDPAQTFKMAARLQAATASKHPVLLLVDGESGHGIGDSLSQAIDRTADSYAFLFDQLGMTYRDRH